MTAPREVSREGLAARGQVKRGYEELGRLLREWRVAATMTQAQLAEHVLFSRSTVANVEVGRQSVGREFWERADAAIGARGELESAFEQVRELVQEVRRQATQRSVDPGHAPETVELDDRRRASGLNLELKVSGDVNLSVITTVDGSTRVVIEAAQPGSFVGEIPTATTDAQVFSLDSARLRRAGRSTPGARQDGRASWPRLT